MSDQLVRQPCLNLKRQINELSIALTRTLTYFNAGVESEDVYLESAEGHKIIVRGDQRDTITATVERVRTALADALALGCNQLDLIEAAARDAVNSLECLFEDLQDESEKVHYAVRTLSEDLQRVTNNLTHAFANQALHGTDMLMEATSERRCEHYGASMACAETTVRPGLIEGIAYIQNSAWDYITIRVIRRHWLGSFGQWKVIKERQFTVGENKSDVFWVCAEHSSRHLEWMIATEVFDSGFGNRNTILASTKPGISAPPGDYTC